MLKVNILGWLNDMSMELLHNIIEFMACFVDDLGIYVFLWVLCDRKKNISYWVQVSVGLFLGLTASWITYLGFGIEIQVITLFILPFIFSVLFLEQSLGKKIYFNIIWNVILMISNLFVGQVVSKLLNIDGEVMLEQGTVSRVIMLVIHKVVLLLIVLIFISYNKKYKFDYKQWIITVVQFVSVMSVGAIFVNLYKNNAFKDNAEQEIIAIALILSVMCIVVCICQHVLNVQNMYKIENEKIKTYLDEEEKNIKRIEELYEHSSIIRHDVKHYAVMMKNLIKEENYLELEKMIDELGEGELSGAAVIYTKNTALNAVLNDKMSVCKKNNIIFRIVICTRVPKSITTNVCVILSNLLDNAIEAEKKEEKGYIKLYIHRQGDMLCMSIANKITVSVIKSNPKLETTKNNKKEHGFGIKSINKRVADMDGMYMAREDNGEFKSTVVIPIEIDD